MGDDLKSAGLSLEALELDIPEALRPSTLRKLGIRPELDAAIDALPPVTDAGLRHFAVSLLQLYRRLRPEAVGNRCVYEPSCSRYSELAFRTKPPATAFRLTVRRLCRCKPGHGGTDLSELELPT